MKGDSELLFINYGSKSSLPNHEQKIYNDDNLIYNAKILKYLSLALALYQGPKSSTPIDENCK